MKYKWKSAAAVTLTAVIIMGNGLIRPVQMEALAAESQLEINYSGFMHGKGWNNYQNDNTICRAPHDSYITAVKANLLNQPEDMTGTIAYQVNLSRTGWMEWVENGAQAGSVEGDMPLEAIRMELTGQLEENYDIYYSVFQNGTWTEWAQNGGSAGQEGVGYRIDGVRMSVTAKGAGAPAAAVSRQIDPGRPMVALTFDDGPNASVTNRILNSLEQYGGRATFFMVGSRVEGANIASVRRMAELNCEVANHTYEHKNITKLSRDGIRTQLLRTNEKIQATCGVSPTLMRPPGGSKNDSSLAAVGSTGMSSILWSLDTLDWKTRNAQNTIDTVLANIKDGDIVLMHDLYSTTADAAEVIIPKLTEMGYQLVTVSELASHRGGILPGKSYSEFR